jgi:hypothetical protein
MVSVIMLNVVYVSVIMLNIVYGKWHYVECHLCVHDRLFKLSFNMLKVVHAECHQ